MWTGERLIGKNARYTIGLTQDPAAMWTPSESSSTNNDRRAPQRSRHPEQRNFTTSNLVDSSRQRDFRYDREDIYSSTSPSTSAAVLSPPRRSLSYEDRLSAMASASTSLSASNTPIPSPSTLRTTRPLGSKRSNLTSSTPASPSVASPAASRFAQSNSDNALGPAATPLRSPMFSEPSSSRRPSGATGSRRSSAARSPDAAAAALAASKYDMKRMLSKPAPMASSFGSSSAGSAGILSAASRNEDDVFGTYHQSAAPQLDSIDPLAYSSSVDTSRSYLKNANPDAWPASDSPALGAVAGGKTFPDSVAGSTFNSTATRTRSRNASSTSSSAAQSQPSQQQQPSSSRTQQPHRARALTQTSSMTAATTTSSSVFPPPSSTLSHSNTSYYADYSVDSHSNSAAASSSSRSRSRIPPMPGVAFPISDDVGGSFLSGSGSGPGAGPGRKAASPDPTRALTPASAIAYAYQQQQQLRSGGARDPREFDSSTRPSPSPSPNPSFYTASSSSASESGRAYGGDSEYYQHQQYLNTPFGSARTLGGGGSPISPTSGRVVSNGDPESGTLGNVEKSKSSGALRTLGRKVSGKFSRKSSGGFTTSGRRGTIAAGAEDVINVGGVGSSVSTNDGSFLGMSSEFGGYEGDDSAGGGVGSGRAMAVSASSSSRGGSGRSRSQYDVSQRRSPSGYFGDASGAGLADVSSSSIDASLPTSPVSPASQQQQYQPSSSTTASHQRPSKLTKTKSLLRLSQQNRSVTDPTPVPEPPTPSSTGVGTSIWKMVKKFSSSTLREKHRAGASPTEPVPPVPALPPGVASSGSVSRRSSVSDHDYGVVLGGGSAAFGGGFGRDEGGGGRFSISSVVSRPKSEAKRSMIGRSRSGTVVSSAQSHGHGVGIQNRGAPPPDLPRSGPRSPRHEHNRSLSQSRTTTTATLSSSPISSDLSSSKYFFGRQQSSPRTSTSSYLAYSDIQDYGPPPPLPMSQKQQQTTPSAPQHILPPDEIAAMLNEYGDDLGGIGSAKEDDDGSSSNYHNHYSSAASRKSFASSAAPQKGSGLSAPPSRRSTSRDPPSSRKSSTSGKAESASGHGDLQGRNPLASMSSSSLTTAPAKPAKIKKIGNFQHPPLHMMRKSGSNPAASRYVAVQGSGETSPSSAGPKTSPAKKNVLHRLMRSKSEVNLTPAPSTTTPPTPPTARPPPPRPMTATTESKERRRTSPPVPSPSSPTKRWSIDERRGSAGSGNLLNPPSAPLSPTRAASFDLQRSRPPSFSTTVMFRDLTEAPAVKRSEDEKNKMWDMLLEKSEKAGGTLHAKIDSSFY